MVNNFALSGLNILRTTIEGPDAAAFSATQSFFSTLSGISGEFSNTILFNPKHTGASQAELVLHTDAEAASGTAGEVFRFALNGSAILLGDYNNDGRVDAADYAVWRDNQSTTHALSNDPIGGTVGVAQYNQWRAHFGQTAGSDAGTVTNAAVPEPATFVLSRFAQSSS